MSDLDDSFAKLLGRQPSDAERQSLYRVRDALGLKNNDALWLVLMALQHYQGQYEKFPQAIAQAAKDTLVNFKVTADATVKASAEAAKADLAQAVPVFSIHADGLVLSVETWKNPRRVLNPLCTLQHGEIAPFWMHEAWLEAMRRIVDLLDTLTAAPAEALESQ